MLLMTWPSGSATEIEAMHRRLDVEEDRNIRERNKMSSSSGVGVDRMGRGRRELLWS